MSERVYGVRWVRCLVASVSLLLLAGITSRVSSRLIDVWHPDRPMPRDLLFETLPYLQWTQYLTDVAVFGALGLLLVHILRTRIRELPVAVGLFGIMHMSRAVIILLTPLAGPLGNGAHYGLIPAIQNGEFPSGHAASALMCYLLVDAEGAPRLKVTMLVLLIVQVASLLLSHGHYSIDIIGGLLLAYFVYYEFEPRLCRIVTQGR